MKGPSAGNGNAACGPKAYGNRSSKAIVSREQFGPATRWSR